MKNLIYTEDKGELWIGDYQDVLDCSKDFISINVAFEHEKRLPDSLYAPFLLPVIKNGTQTGVVIFQPMLNILAELIDFYIKDGKKVLVNCNMGMERSPLVCVWFLNKKKSMSFDDAYKFVKDKRPQTLDRREWVNFK